MGYWLAALLLLATTVAQAVKIPRPPSHGGCTAAITGEFGAEWHGLSDSHGVRIDVERRLYQIKDSNRFYIHVRITNDNNTPVSVDLRDAHLNIYPNQWELMREPRRGPIDELRTLKTSLGPERTQNLLQAHAQHALSEIPSHHALDFYRESYADLDDAGGFNDGCYLIVSLDGQMFFTDGHSCWQVNMDEMSSITKSEVLNRAEFVLPLPIALSPLPETAIIFHAPPTL